MAAILASEDNHNYVRRRSPTCSSRSKLINFRPDLTHYEVRPTCRVHKRPFSDLMSMSLSLPYTSLWRRTRHNATRYGPSRSKNSLGIATRIYKQLSTDRGFLELHPRQLQVPTRSPECLNNKAVELWYKALLPVFLPARRSSLPIGVGSFGFVAHILTCTGWSLRLHGVTKSLILWQPRLNCR